MESILTKSQKRVFERKIGNEIIYLTIRYDDECGNSHNSFAMTADIYVANRPKIDRYHMMGGCCHDEIAKFFPEYAKYIKWHSCSSDMPMYYIENTMYHAEAISKHQDKWDFYLENKSIRIVDGKEKAEMIEKYGDNASFKEWYNSMAKEPDLEAARSCAIWPEATLEQLQSKDALMERLPALMKEFKKDVEELGFIY